jgi:hypothetical protein
MFEIRVVADRAHDPSVKIGRGRIQIGSFEEMFEMSFEHWSPTHYERQWRDGADRLIKNELTSCLLASVTRPAGANFFFWWPMYRVEDNIYIQNQVLFSDQLDEPFDLSDPYRFIRARETVTEAGGPISEWQTTIDHISSWLSSDRPS